MHQCLTNTIDFLANGCGFACTVPVKEKESGDYSAHTFLINNRSILFRAAKITPAKTGQFVTLWKRTGDGPIQPFDATDKIGFVIICAKTATHSGFFIFPGTVLCDKKIISGNGREGKRALRVYPPWDEVTSQQAIQTKQWQCRYFIHFGADKKASVARVRELFSE